MPGTVPGIVSDRAGESARIRLAQNVVGKPLGAFSDGSVVDGVGAEIDHATSASSGSERDNGPERVVKRLPFPRFDVFQYAGDIMFVAVLCQPARYVFQGS